MTDYPTPQPTTSCIWTIDQRWFDVLNPPMVQINEIAHGLSQLCRYNGHLPVFYSVAEHSIAVSELLSAEGHPTEVAVAGLFHDAAEAYIGDMVNPLKKQMPRFSEIEARIMIQVDEFAGTDYDRDLRDIVLDADMAVYDYEVRNIRFGAAPWDEMLPRHAKSAFLQRADLLFDQLG